MKVPEFPKSFPRLETDRLVLREITLDDRWGIFRNFSDIDVAKWFFEEPLTQIEQVDEIIQAFIKEFEQGNGLTWAVVLKESNEVVGTCGYGEVKVGVCGEIGFDLAKEQWGKGLMSEALGAIVDYGFDVFALGNVEAHTYATNSRAIRLLKKLGFQAEELRDDSFHFSLLSRDRRNPGS
jgi:ribosomal-protein-alanine N-acetyltransferase